MDAIFYPCMSYNLDEHLGDNHYNCPVVAYYPEVVAGATCTELNRREVHLRLLSTSTDRKDFVREMHASRCANTSADAAPKRGRTGGHDAAYARVRPRICRSCADKGIEEIAAAREEGQADRRAGGPALPRGPRGQPRHRPADHRGLGAAVVTEDSV